MVKKIKKLKYKPSKKSYMLFGCPIAIDSRYTVDGYIGLLSKNGNNEIGLVSKQKAFIYTDDKTPGHGTPDDWIKLFKEDYGLNVHPIFFKGENID